MTDDADALPVEPTAEPDAGPEPRNVTLYTAAEVADLLRLASPRSVYKLARNHKWSFAKTIGGRVRYERRGLLAWIRRRPSHLKRPPDVVARIRAAALAKKALDDAPAQVNNCAEEGGPPDAET